MLKKELVNNLNKNYLRMECDASEDINKYEYKMMNVDNIVGLLPCHVRFINSTSYLYYEITATTTMAEVFANRKMEKKDLKKLAMAINHTIDSLEEYLLEGENIVFDPEYIFMDAQSEEIFFIYYPYYGTMNKENFLQLAEFLVTHINHDDEKLITKTYELYEQATIGRNKVNLKEIFRYLDSDALLDLIQYTDSQEKIVDYISPQEELQMVMEDEEMVNEIEKIEVVPEKEKPMVLSLFEYKKGKLQEKRISYAVEEKSIVETYIEKENTDKR